MSLKSLEGEVSTLMRRSRKTEVEGVDLREATTYYERRLLDALFLAFGNFALFQSWSRRSNGGCPAAV